MENKDTDYQKVARVGDEKNNQDHFFLSVIKSLHEAGLLLSLLLLLLLYYYYYYYFGLYC